MNLQTNGPAWVSLGLGIGTIVLAMVAFFIGSFPIVSLINTLVVPLQFVTAFGAVVSGIVGFRTASALYGVGRVRAMSGFALGATGIVLRMVIWLFGLG